MKYKNIKEMSQKAVSAKLDAKKVERLEKVFGSAYSGVQSCVDFFFLQRSLAIKDLKTIFKREEIMALCDMHNGTMFQTEMAQKSVLSATIEDSELYESTLSRFNVKKENLTTKISELSEISVFWLIFEIRQMWEQNENMETFIERLS